jgi:hypothetical protein
VASIASSTVSRRPISRLRTSDRALGLRRNACDRAGKLGPQGLDTVRLASHPFRPARRVGRLYTVDLEHAVELPRRCRSEERTERPDQALERDQKRRKHDGTDVPPRNFLQST